MSPLRGFAVNSRVDQPLVKPEFTQSREFFHDSRLAGRPLEKSAGIRMASTSLSHRSPMNKGELPCRGGCVETPDRASLQFVPSGIRSTGEKIFLQAGTGFGLTQPTCFFWP